MKIAQFKSVTWDYICYGDEKFDGVDGYVRVSEWVDVSFTPIKSHEKELDALQKQLLELEQKKAKEVERLNAKIKELESA